MALAAVSRSKKLVGLLVGFAALPLLTGGSLAAYARYPLRTADRNTRKVCDSASVGGPTSGLKERGASLGLRVSELPADSEHDARLVFIGGFAMARYFCEVSHAGGRVVSKQRTFLD